MYNDNGSSCYALSDERKEAMNKIILMGRLVRDPEVRYTQTGKVVCQFTLAIDDGFGENKTTSFVNIVVWGKIGELCGNSLTKGQRALIEGRLQIRSYDGKDGKIGRAHV